MFEILKTMGEEELRSKAIDDLIECQNKIIKQCQNDFDFYNIELEKTTILREITGNLLECKEESEELSNKICKLKAKAKRVAELKAKLEEIKRASN